MDSNPENRPTTDGAPLIFDVGMHQAEDTEFYLAKGFRVVAVEASPELCEEAGRRLRAQVESGQLVIVHAAIAEKEGPVTLWLNPRAVWNTTVPSWSERNARIGSPSESTVTVPGIRFESLLETYGVPYYLKVDIEGSDMLCLEALLGREAVPRHLSIESDKVSFSAVEREFEVMRALGYRRFKVVAQHRHPRTRPPYPPREGAYADWRFTLDSSGLFGEEAPGRWMSSARALARYRAIHLGYRLWGNDGLLLRGPGQVVRRVAPQGFAGWYDTHATR